MYFYSTFADSFFPSLSVSICHSSGPSRMIHCNNLSETIEFLRSNKPRTHDDHLDGNKQNDDKFHSGPGRLKAYISKIANVIKRKKKVAPLLRVHGA